MSYLGIKKRQGIPIVREGEAKPLNTNGKRTCKCTERRITVSLYSIDIFDFSPTQNQLNVFLIYQNIVSIIVANIIQYVFDYTIILLFFLQPYFNLQYHIYIILIINTIHMFAIIKYMLTKSKSL